VEKPPKFLAAVGMHKVDELVADDRSRKGADNLRGETHAVVAVNFHNQSFPVVEKFSGFR
jgi:hypothetical protein